jgi:hypothetical protein
MAVIKVKIDDDVHEIEKLTLGETWLLEREYGVEDVENPSNAFGAYVGLLAIATRRRSPELSEAQARVKVEALTDERIEVIKEEETADDPTPAGTEKASAGPPSASKQAKTRAKRGAQC